MAVDAMKDALAGLFAACMIAAVADALFDGHADGLRLACGLTVALSVMKLIGALIT